MLIVPIVEGLNWRRPPPLTVALILINVLAFFLYQTGDTGRAERAFEAYFRSSLPQLELPAYRARLAAAKPQLAAENANPQLTLRLMEQDAAFMRELRGGKVIAPDSPNYAQWKEDRARFDALLNQLSYRKYGFTPADPKLLTAFTSMFLHGDLMHLVGNMTFLFIVGVAVESALGGLWMLPLYLAAGLAGDALHWAAQPASPVPLVGASGAIAGLMGLFTVLYGLRRVNFFYWLVFIFGFKPMRGIVVLPVWIAWELGQFAMDRQGSVGYMAHAGGLVGGAVLGFLVMKRFSGTRVEQFHGEREQEAIDKAEYEKARALAAKMEFKAASAVFARLAARWPEPELVRQWYAVTKHDPLHPDYHRAVNALLALPKVDGPMRAFQKQVFNDYFVRAQAPCLEPRTLAAIGLAFARAGHVEEAERAAETLLKQAPAEPRLQVLWEALAHALSQPPGDESRVKRARRYRALLSAHAKVTAATKG